MTLSLDVPRYTGRAVPGHTRWHPDIPAVAEVITGGSVRLECEASDLLCGPIVVVGAEPGDVIVVDVLGLGRSDGVYAPAGHPGVIGCAPALPSAADALSTDLRGRAVGGCAIAPLTGGSRILLPVEVRGAKLSAGDLHFPGRGEECHAAGRAGWIDLRVHLTRKGVERFGVTGPMLMP